MIIRILIFISAALILGIGFLGLSLLGKDLGVPVFLGSATLGGGLLICALFSLKMPWHGYIGAAVLSLLGLSRGILNAPGIFRYALGERTRGVAPLLELFTFVICGSLLIAIYRAWSRSRSLDSSR